MRMLKVLLVCGVAVVAGSALAAPNNSSTGQKCEESASGVSHTIGGKNYTCDKCVFSQCSTTGNSISNCVRKTEWTNCVEAAGSGGGNGTNRVNVPNRMAPANNPQNPTGAAGTNRKQ
jgi:hypothetical protein